MAQKPGPKPKATSKRNDPRWLASTLFLTAEAKEAMGEIQALQKLLKLDVQDQSDIISAALQSYLPAEKDRLELLYRKG